MSQDFDEKDADSIVAYAKTLEETSLRAALRAQGREDALSGATKACGKGSLGNLVQHAYFGMPADSRREADFSLANLELKVTPLKKTKKGLKSKERLVLSLIDYQKLSKEKDFETSSFWAKNKHLLLLFYLYERDVPIAELIFKIVREWLFPPADLKIIRDDWNFIVQKVRDQKAHELSERDTLYLGACTKGAGAGSWRSQDYGPRAKQRAFSLKSSYLNRIIDDSLGSGGYVAICDDGDFDEGVRFEDWVVDRFRQFYGKSLSDLSARYNTKTSAKHAFHLAAKAIAKSILGVEKGEILEFDKANIQIKTIRLMHNGGLKEAMSFRQIRYKDIVNEEWEESLFFEDLSKRFFFVIFQNDAKGVPLLKRVMFWSMPAVDMRGAQKVWEDTKKKVAAGRYKDFLGMADHPIAHVRPKGRNAADKMETPQGTYQSKKCFWLGRDYILRQIAR